jgi:hypothetical protein
VAITPAVAAAEPDEKPPTVIVSVPLMALSDRAFALQAERLVLPCWSAAITVGARDGAGGDYQSTTVALGADLRRWHFGRERGLFWGPRLEAAVIHMSEGDRSLGTATILTGGMIAGARLMIADRFELTPNIGLAIRHDVAHGGIAGQTRPTILYGVTAGWAF